MANTRSHVVTIKFTPDEFEMLQAGANAARTTQSEYLRGCLLRDRLMDRDPVAMKIATPGWEECSGEAMLNWRHG